MKYARPIWLLVVAAAFAAGSGWALENIRQISARSLVQPVARRATCDADNFRTNWRAGSRSRPK